ncbi:MAG: DUF547 domain-containing protein [Gemmatimonadetes bacterium]|nr:DUF547 domain-containing protein [Gemmatimonadota bacterium]
MTAILLAVALLWTPAAGSDLHADYDALLSTYVKDGLVDYDGWYAHKKSRRQLMDYVARLESTDPGALSRDEALAFWINLYNATTLRLILDNYPVESIKDLGGFLSSPWKKELVTVDGEELTLNEIENDIIRPRFQDPRIHFALNCAAVSCPPLAPFAFTGAEISEQLDQVSQQALQDERFVRIERDGDEVRIHLTRLFDWYEDDWENVREFLATYRPADRAVLLDEDAELKYNDYSWKLNALHARNP